MTRLVLTSGSPRPSASGADPEMPPNGRPGRYQQAAGHHGLALACHADGDPDQARFHWQQALACYPDLGTPEADNVRAQLKALTGPACLPLPATE